MYPLSGFIFVFHPIDFMFFPLFSRLLTRQLVEPVQWQSIMSDICESKYDQTSVYEVGPGRQLTAILAKIDRKLVRKCKNIEV